MKQYKYALIVAIILFFIPFFWLKMGEMSLGGDSGRLYFYDPVSYLFTYTLYNYIGSGTGTVTSGYINIPYTLLLVLLKWIFQSSTILISTMNGLSLSVGFYATFLVVKELLQGKENKLKEQIITLSSILAGFCYVFSQISIYNGWENALPTHSQAFLNPLMFYLILKYVLFKKTGHALVALFITFLFAFNFSFIGAPGFFSFYPLALTFIFLYAKFIRRVAIPYKKIIIGIAVFFSLHAFHLGQEITGLFTSGSTFNTTVFVQEGEFSRSGLEYFLAIASNTKVSVVWMALTQLQKQPIFAIFIVLPITLIGGFFFNRGKTLLLTGIIFLITLFLATANITNLGFFFYQQLFRIPGFSMFRNFHGQWTYVFLFFYSLLFGQAMAIVTNRLEKRLKLYMIVTFFALFFVSGLPLITGKIVITTHSDSGLRYAIQMDPVYEEVLAYFKTDPINGKVILFPFTGPGYQIIQGVHGGIYQGLPTIAYLTGKSDFSGFGSTAPFDNMFLQFMQKRDYRQLNKVLSMLNIKHIFYNSDPFIYSKVLQNYLYAHVSNYSPKNQDEYKSFIEKFPVAQRIDFGDKYHIYQLKSDSFLPHIFTTDDIIFASNPITFPFVSYFNPSPRTTIFNAEDFRSKKDKLVLQAINKSPLMEIIDNSHLHRHDPYIARRLDDLYYPLTLLKEQFTLWRARNQYKKYRDFSSLYLAKRINELNKWTPEIRILNKEWVRPKLWEIDKWYTYNYWEAGLTRYKEDAMEFLYWIDKTNQPDTSKTADKIRLTEQLYQHHLQLISSIKKFSHIPREDREYLLSYVNNMFSNLFTAVEVQMDDPSSIDYKVEIPPEKQGEYEIYVEKNDNAYTLTSTSYISIDNNILKPLDNQMDGMLVPFNNVLLANKTNAFTLNVTLKNLIDDSVWLNSGSAKTEDGVVELQLHSVSVSSQNSSDTGMVKEIHGWKPQTQYIISFDYLTFGDDIIFTLYDKRYRVDVQDDLITVNLLQRLLNASSWKTHKVIITSALTSEMAAIQFIGMSNKINSKILVRNLSVYEIVSPNVYLKNVVSEGAVPVILPKITFTKINSTKYKIQVTGAKDPYTLVFLESFSKDWNLININKEARIPFRDMIVDAWTGNKNNISENRSNRVMRVIRAGIARVVGTVGKTIVDIFVRTRQDDSSVSISYFEGLVSEGKHRNTFLEPETFETWGQNSIAYAKHFKVNGYANAWNISPEDVYGSENYVLVLELVSQKAFYVFLALSCTTLIVLLIYSLRMILKRNEKKN